MLLELYIKDIALIQELRVRFDAGFSALTGETGAGKSIIMGALNTLLGERVKGDLLSEKAQKGTVEALFDISGQSQIHSVLTAQGIELEEGEPLVLRRELVRQGSHRNYVNGRYVTVALLKLLGNLLIDFHGQHDHQSLFHTEEQMNLLDRYAGAMKQREALRELSAEIKELSREKESLKKLDLEKKERIEFLEFQIKEISEANLKEDEEERLDEERNLLAHSEKLSEWVGGALLLVGDADGSASEKTGKALHNITEAAKIDSSLEPVLEQLQSIQIAIQEVVGELQNRSGALQSDPERLTQVEDRLSLIWRLKKKYGASLPEVLRFLNSQKERLRELESAGERIGELEEKINELTQKQKKTASLLTKARKEASPELEKKIEKELHALGMKGAQFKAAMEPQEINSQGAEKVEFFIAPNVGGSLKPLRSTASGGEISRLMLALKVVFSRESDVGTMIFDEIDVNIGGGVAVEVGKKMRELGRRKQILCITHLPQVASRAQINYKVSKATRKNQTQTSISRLDEKEKTIEIARMLQGEEVSSVALEHARELIQGKK